MIFETIFQVSLAAFWDFGICVRFLKLFVLKQSHALRQTPMPQKQKACQLIFSKSGGGGMAYAVFHAAGLVPSSPK
jgi:hypothetical protein